MTWGISLRREICGNNSMAFDQIVPQSMRKVAALRIGIVAIEIAADQYLALVRLR